MSSTETSDTRQRRRPARAARVSGELQQRPFGRVTRPYRPIEVLSADNVAALHETALKVLRDIGMRVLEDSARDHFRRAGADDPGHSDVSG